MPVLATDVDGYVTAVSELMAELLGTTRKEAEDAQSNLRDLELFATEEAAQQLEQLFARREAVEFTVPRQDHSRLRCLGAPVLDKEGNLTQTVWVFSHPTA